MDEVFFADDAVRAMLVGVFLPARVSVALALAAPVDDVLTDEALVADAFADDVLDAVAFLDADDVFDAAAFLDAEVLDAEVLDAEGVLDADALPCAVLLVAPFTGARAADAARRVVLDWRFVGPLAVFVFVALLDTRASVALAGPLFTTLLADFLSDAFGSATFFLSGMAHSLAGPHRRASRDTSTPGR